MANGTTRLALSKMQMDGKQSGEHEYLEEISMEKIDKKASGKTGKQAKIPLKNPSEHNHSM